MRPEVRLTEKLAARRYSHMMINFRHCRFWWCLGCHWRKVTGEHERRRQAIIQRGHEIAATLPPIKYRRDAEEPPETAADEVGESVK